MDFADLKISAALHFAVCGAWLLLLLVAASRWRQSAKWQEEKGRYVWRARRLYRWWYFWAEWTHSCLPPSALELFLFQLSPLSLSPSLTDHPPHHHPSLSTGLWTLLKDHLGIDKHSWEYELPPFKGKALCGRVGAKVGNADCCVTSRQLVNPVT